MGTALLRNCANWQQYQLMTKGRAEPRDEDQEVTRSERLHWYRYGGGEQMVDARAELCRESGNWQQNKQELSEHMTQMRMETAQEREEVRAHVQRQAYGGSSSVSKQCYEAHMEAQWEEESVRQAAKAVSQEERVEELRRVTEEMLTSRNEYAESTRSLAIKASREDAAAVASSRSIRRTAVVS